MRITSILRTGVVALALTAGITAVAPAYAAQSDQLSLLQQNSNTGPYDGPESQAAAHAAE